jgi:hypothetical protein
VIERRGVLARTWQLAARADALAEVGSYVTTQVAGEPPNVCPHRAGP